MVWLNLPQAKRVLRWLLGALSVGLFFLQNGHVQALLVIVALLLLMGVLFDVLPVLM